MNAFVINQFYRNVGNPQEEKINKDELSKAAWLASILSLSTEQLHQKKALAFAVLAYLENPEDSRFSRLCYVIISRVGVIPLSEHMKEFGDNKRLNMS